MPKFLIDENLSPLLSDYLRVLKYDAKAVREVGLKGKSDEEIIRWVQRNKRVIITADLDFGRFFYFRTFGGIGVIILRSKSQNSLSFQEILSYLHEKKVLRDKRLDHALTVAEKGKYRMRKFI